MRVSCAAFSSYLGQGKRVRVRVRDGVRFRMRVSCAAFSSYLVRAKG